MWLFHTKAFDHKAKATGKIFVVTSKKKKDHTIEKSSRTDSK